MRGLATGVSIEVLGKFEFFQQNIAFCCFDVFCFDIRTKAGNIMENLVTLQSEIVVFARWTEFRKTKNRNNYIKEHYFYI